MIVWKSRMLFVLGMLIFCFGKYYGGVEDKFLPYVGNGNIAMQVNADGIFVADIFNGPAVAKDKVTHRASIPNYLQSITFENSLNDISYDLDVKKAVVYRHSTIIHDSQKFPITERFYCHGLYDQLLVYEISSDSGQLDSQECFSMTNLTGTNDFSLSITEYDNVTLFLARTLEEETNWTQIQKVTYVKPSSEKFCSDFSVPFRYIISFNDESIENYWKFMSIPDLFSSHFSIWEKYWSSLVSVDGNDELNSIIQNSIYYLLSSLTPNGNYSLSPGTLSSNSYNGHTFWDAETWMYPPLLVLYPEFAKSCLKYRLDRREGASKKAVSNGYSGYMIPWESAVSGIEVCPLSAKTGKLEQHISSDVVLAFKNYYQMFSSQMTEDDKLNMLDLVAGIADFWVSRVSIRPSNHSQYDILDVIPPDEYHEGDNSIFTNAGAQMSLFFASKLAKEIKPSRTNPRWDDIANRLYFPRKEIGGNLVDWEFEEYSGDTIKQADVVLLSYPLMWPDAQTKADLEYYEPKVDKNGPSMTYGIHAIEWLELGNFTNAYRNFLRSFQENVQPPFWVWTEVQGGGGAVNFITGAGNFLQGLVFGYGGMRIFSDHLRFSPVLVPETKMLTLQGLKYQGNSFTLKIGESQSIIICEFGEIYVEVQSTKKKFSLKEKQQSTIDNEEFFISIV